MSAAGEVGLAHYDTLYGPRTQPEPEPWDCAECGKPQMREPHEMHGEKLCGSCHWERHEQETSE